MSDYQTGDLLLVNQWSLGSIVNHAFDPESQWSDVGIFIVDRPNTSTNSSYGVNNGYVNNSGNQDEAVDDGVRVMMMTSAGIKLFTVDQLLRTPSVQAVAHRPLAVKDRKSFQQKIANSIMSAMRAVQENPRRVTNSPFPLALKALLSEDQSIGYTRSSHGTLLDSKGRDVKVSGFVKGNPDSQMKNDFTSGDLVGSILAQAELIKYDPEILLSDFQEGGRFDDLYGDEVQLFPRKPAEDVRQYLLKQAREEAEAMVMKYFESMPVSSFDCYRSSIPFPVPRSEEYIENQDGQTDEFGTGYPDQMLSGYTTAAARERRGNTGATALVLESDTIDQKIRQRKEEADQYVRPRPGFNRNK